MQLSSLSQPDDQHIVALNGQDIIVCLDRSHVIIRSGIEAQVSPTEYFLCKLLFLASHFPSYNFVRIELLEQCFRLFHARPVQLKKILEAPLPPTHAIQKNFALEHNPNGLALPSELDLRMLHAVVSLKKLAFEHDPDELALLSELDHHFSSIGTKLAHKHDSSGLNHHERRFLLYLQTYDGTRDIRKRISKHYSGANTRFHDSGIGIHVYSVGHLHLAGYIASFLPPATPPAIETLPLPFISEEKQRC